MVNLLLVGPCEVAKLTNTTGKLIMRHSSTGGMPIQLGSAVLLNKRNTARSIRLHD